MNCTRLGEYITLLLTVLGGADPWTGCPTPPQSRRAAWVGFRTLAVIEAPLKIENCPSFSFQLPLPALPLLRAQLPFSELRPPVSPYFFP